MKTILMIVFMVFAMLGANAKIMIYKGTSSNWSNCVATYNEGKIYKGTSSNWSSCIATFNNGKVYKGTSSNWSDCVATYKDGRLYKGNSTNWSDCIFTFSSEYEVTPGLVMFIIYNFFPMAF